MYTEKIVNGFKATLGARLLTNVLNGLLIFLLAGVLLTPDEYGLLFLVIAIVSIAQIGSDLGLGRSTARYISERKETDPMSVPFLIRTSVRYRLLLLSVVAGTLIVARDAIAIVLETPELAMLLLVGAIYLFTLSLYSYHQTIFQGFNHVGLSALLEVINTIGRVTFVVAFSLLGFGVAGALFGYVLGAFSATIVGVVLLYRRFYTAYVDGGGSRSLRNRLLRYSIPLTASQSANVLDRRVDTVLVGFFLTPVAVSYYVLGKQISGFVTVLSGSLGFTISPSLAEKKADESIERAAEIYETSLEYMLLLYLPAAAGLFLISEPAILLVFGSEYSGAAPVLQVLGLYVMLQSITDVTTNGLDYLGRAKIRAVAKLTTSIGNVVLNVILIPTHGVVGAAVATVITFGVYTFVNVYVMHIELSLDLRRLGWSVGLAAAITLIMGLFVLFLVPFVSTLPTLVAVIAVSILIWGVLATASGLVKPQDVIVQLT